MPTSIVRSVLVRVSATIAIAAMQGSCANPTAGLKQLPPPLVVTVQDFEPHWFFNGNQMEAWVEFTLAAEQGAPIKVVSTLDWSGNFEGPPGGTTLKLPVREGSCPVLRADGTKYRIETRFEDELHRDIPGAHLILTSCSPLEP